MLRRFSGPLCGARHECHMGVRGAAVRLGGAIVTTEWGLLRLSGSCSLQDAFGVVAASGDAVGAGEIVARGQRLSIFGFDSLAVGRQRLKDRDRFKVRPVHR
jgi:hypothetical protein